MTKNLYVLVVRKVNTPFNQNKTKLDSAKFRYSSMFPLSCAQ